MARLLLELCGFACYFLEKVVKILQVLIHFIFVLEVLTKYRIKSKMWKAGWFSQERSVKKCKGVWWNMVVVTPDQ